MSYNGSGVFQINSSGQPVVTGTVISSTAFNALTADLATGLSTAITKDGQTTTTARIVFAQGVSSTLVTDATSATTGSIITAGGISAQKALWVGTTTTLAGALTYGGVTLSNAVTGTGNMVLSASPTLTGTLTAAAATFSSTVTLTAALLQATASAATPYKFLNVSGSTTAISYGDITNTSGILRIGVENSGGGGLASGTTAYAGYIGTDAAKPLQFGYNGAVLAQVDAGGINIGGTGASPNGTLNIGVAANSQIMVNTAYTFNGNMYGFLHKNASSGSGAQVIGQLDNGTNALTMGCLGTNFTTSGVYQANRSYMVASGTPGFVIGTSQSGPLIGIINNAEAWRTGTDGSFLVGTTAAGGAGFVSCNGLNVNHAQVAGWRQATYYAGNSEIGIGIVDSTSTNNATFAAFLIGGGPTQIGGILNAANVAVTYNTTSDARLKNILKEQRDFREAIQNIWVGDVEYKASPGSPWLSVIAQDAARWFPDGVTIGKTEEDMWHAEYGRFGILALWGVKDLYNELGALRAEISALKAGV